MTEQEIQQPQWLLELENRKKKPRLAHEAGAGSPCLTCTTACPGLDLHFWRKICKNCKCSRDEHDVCDDDFPQFDLLFGPNSKSKTRHTRLRINNKHSQNETTFEWEPPNTTKDLAEDYMNALPLEKLPIKGSAGAVLRKQQLQKQIPLHDIDYKACDELTDQEKQEFERYLENLKNCAGQGKVYKFFAAREYLRAVQGPNSYDSENYNSIIIPSQSSVNLRTPSSFMPKISPPLLRRNNVVGETEKPTNVTLSPVKLGLGKPVETMSSDVNSNLGRYHHALIKNRHDNSLAQVGVQPGAPNPPCEILGRTIPAVNNSVRGKIENLATPNQQVESSNNAELAEQMITKELLPPSALDRNDIVGSTLDSERLKFIREQLHLKYSNKEDPNRAALSRSDIIRAKEHPGVKSEDQISSPYVSITETPNVMESFTEDRNRLPAYMTQDINRNKTTSANAQQNVAALKADFDTLQNVRSHVINSEKTNNPVFPEQLLCSPAVNNAAVEQLQENMQGMTVNAERDKNCHECKDKINSGDVVVTAEKAKGALWHPGCFVCSVCQELLADLVYFYYKEKLYCGRDLATLLKIPRCFACDELIFVREYTVAEGHNYHLKHFCCWECDKPLAGQQYTPENDRPICLPCYQSGYAKICAACKKTIAADQQGVCVKNLDFHVSAECFCCYECKKNLLNSRMLIKGDKPFCSKECVIKFLN